MIGGMQSWTLLVGLALLGCGSDDDPNCVDVGSAIAAYQHEDGEGSHAGRACIESGCHLASDLGPNAPAYHAAGTVYKADKVTPAGGITVRFLPLDNTATATTAITDDEGNFFVLASLPTPFPSIPEVTGCPDVNTMIEGALDPSYGNCAVGGCHSQGAGRGPVFVGD